MHESSEAILQIADCDRQVQQSQKKLDLLPAKRAKIRKTVDRIEGQYSQLEKKHLDMHQQVQMREKLIEVENKKTSAANQRMMEVSNQKEYMAIQKEIDGAARTIKKVEDQILAVTENMDPLKTELDELKEQLDAAMAEYEADDQVFKDEEALCLKTISDAKTLVETLKPKVEETLWPKYKKLMQRGLIPAAVKISDSFCNGCAASLLAQVYNEIIQNGQGECSSCKRLLFYEAPEVPEEPETPKKPASKKKAKAG